MTLLITVYAALTTTILWYKKDANNIKKLGTLSLMYWGASLMWFVDAIYEYAELGADYFIQAPMDMLNDGFLGLSVVALGMIIWGILFLSRDPEGVIRKALLKKK